MLQAFTRQMHLKRPFVISAGAQEVAHNAFVRVDGGGQWGLGEGVPSPRVTGRSLEDILGFVAPQARMFGSLAHENALAMANGLADTIQAGRAEGGPGPAAMDLALLDLAGRLQGRTARELLGLQDMASIPTSITVSLDHLEDMVAEAEGYSREGFTVLKVKLGNDPLPSSRLLRAIKDALPSVTVRVDANEAWSMRTASIMMPLLDRYEVELLEQPLHRDSHDEMRELARRSPVPIVADEMVRGPADVEIIERERLAHGINIKLQKVGGLTVGARMAARARELGLKVMVGCFIESGVGMAAAAQLVGLCDWADLDGHLLLRDNPVPGPPVELGVVSTPMEPGLGHGGTEIEMNLLMGI